MFVKVVALRYQHYNGVRQLSHEDFVIRSGRLHVQSKGEHALSKVVFFQMYALGAWVFEVFMKLEAAIILHRQFARVSKIYHNKKASKLFKFSKHALISFSNGQ